MPSKPDLPAHPNDWLKTFLENVGVDDPLQNSLPSAKRAWERLKSAGIGDITGALLYQCYAFGGSVSSDISNGVGRINSSLGKVRYAEQVAHEGQEGSSAKLEDKRKAQWNRAAETMWPFQNERVKTLADAAATYPVIGGLPLEQAPAVMGKARQDIERFDCKILLAILAAGAKAHGVPLSLMELAELWDTAGQKRDSDVLNRKNTLQRFFSYDDIKNLEPVYLEQFEEMLRQMREAEKPG